LLATCGPFTDVAADVFCPFVLEIFYLGITTGTTATTYDPGGNVTRLQMAAFLSRTVDGVLKRGSRRAAMNRFWLPRSAAVLDATTVGSTPNVPACDGTDIWVPIAGSQVIRVRGSDGRFLESWTGASTPAMALSVNGKVFVTGVTQPGALYRIDTKGVAGPVTAVASNLGNSPYGLAFDGLRIWTANESLPGSVSIVTPGLTIPWTVTTVTAGFSALGMIGAMFDGSNVWVTGGNLFRLDSNGAILQTVTVGSVPYLPIFDGANIWVPNNSSDTVSVVRASTGSVLATLSGNGLGEPIAAAFDGERVLVTNDVGDMVSLWKAADLSAIGSISTGAATQPRGPCSDGMNFWVTLRGAATLTRF
jgi:hypothetical protein